MPALQRHRLSVLISCLRCGANIILLKTHAFFVEQMSVLIHMRITRNIQLFSDLSFSNAWQLHFKPSDGWQLHFKPSDSWRLNPVKTLYASCCFSTYATMMVIWCWRRSSCDEKFWSNWSLKLGPSIFLSSFYNQNNSELHFKLVHDLCSSMPSFRHKNDLVAISFSYASFQNLSGFYPICLLLKLMSCQSHVLFWRSW